MVQPVLKAEPEVKPNEREIERVEVKLKRPESVIEKPIKEEQVAEVVNTKVEAVEKPKSAPEIITPESEKPAKNHPSAPGVIVEEIVNYVEETLAEIDNEELGSVKSETVKPSVAEFEHHELTLEDKPEGSNGTKRLGDSFAKDRSLNDLITDDSVKLEHKISNLPVSSMQAAIGINDMFQYIRELFDGNSDFYNETVAKLDSMKDIKEAVVFLQNNYKWKKTEVSLKFVNLLKRRFPNE